MKSSSYDYRLLTEEELQTEFSDDISNSSFTPSTLRPIRLPWHVLRIPFRHAIRITLALPFGAFLFAIVWAMITDYDGAVNVKCAMEDYRKVRNYLPSLSAAIGDFPISQTIWTLCIVLHTPPRLFLYASMYYNYFESICPSSYEKWANLAWVIHILELLGLLGLSVVTSKNNLPFHATCFATFLIGSEIYMVLQCFLQSSRTKSKSQGSTNLEAKSLRIKKILTKLVILCTGVLIFTYFRHERHCEAGVYTIFALVEYIVILSNMGFHGCSYYDFYDRVIVIDICRPFVTANSEGFAWNYWYTMSLENVSKA